MLHQVLRTQAVTSRPGFDIEAVLQSLVEAARRLTDAEGAAMAVKGRRRIESAGRTRGDSSLAVPLPPTAPAPGVLTVYSATGRRFTEADRQVLDLLARLAGSTLTRAALDGATRPLALRR
jgi:hypothetical protein